MKISVVLPCYNEEKNLEKNFKKIYAYLKKSYKDFEVVIVNDGSKDNTSQIAASILKDYDKVKVLDYSKNNGKGYAVKQGVLSSTGEYILFLDIDLSTPIEEIKKLIPFTKEYKVVIGSRALKQSKIEKKQKWYRIILGKIGNKVIQLLLLPGIKDTQCGFKMFEGKLARDVFRFLTISRWGFDFEVLYLAKKRKAKIKEIPINWHDEGDSKLSLKDYLTTLIELLKIKWNNLVGKYK